jgi:hypothetical protein
MAYGRLMGANQSLTHWLKIERLISSLTDNFLHLQVYTARPHFKTFSENGELPMTKELTSLDALCLFVLVT